MERPPVLSLSLGRPSGPANSHARIRKFKHSLIEQRNALHRRERLSCVPSPTPGEGHPVKVSEITGALPRAHGGATLVVTSCYARISYGRNQCLYIAQASNHTMCRRLAVCRAVRTPMWSNCFTRQHHSFIDLVDVIVSKVRGRLYRMP